MAFGVRDSRRQSRKYAIIESMTTYIYRRKKFESPQQPSATSDSPFSARGAIRRLSLRDRSGMTLARLEAQKEQTDILRSWSKEDVSSSQVCRFINSSSLMCRIDSNDFVDFKYLKIICTIDGNIHGKRRFFSLDRKSPQRK